MDTKAFIRLNKEELSSINHARYDNNRRVVEVEDVWLPSDDLKLINALESTEVVYATSYKECKIVLNKRNSNSSYLKQYNTEKVNGYFDDTLNDRFDRANNKAIVKNINLVTKNNDLHANHILEYLKSNPGEKLCIYFINWTSKLKDSLKIINTSFSMDGIIIHRRSKYGSVILEYKPALASKRQKKYEKEEKERKIAEIAAKLSKKCDRIIIRLYNRTVKLLFPESCWDGMTINYMWRMNISIVIRKAISVNRIQRIKGDKIIKRLIANKLVLDRMSEEKDLRKQMNLIKKYL